MNEAADNPRERCRHDPVTQHAYRLVGLDRIADLDQPVDVTITGGAKNPLSRFPADLARKPRVGNCLSRPENASEAVPPHRLNDGIAILASVKARSEGHDEFAIVDPCVEISLGQPRINHYRTPKVRYSGRYHDGYLVGRIALRQCLNHLGTVEAAGDVLDEACRHALNGNGARTNCARHADGSAHGERIAQLGHQHLKPGAMEAPDHTCGEIPSSSNQHLGRVARSPIRHEAFSGAPRSRRGY